MAGGLSRSIQQSGRSGRLVAAGAAASGAAISGARSRWWHCERSPFASDTSGSSQPNLYGSLLGGRGRPAVDERRGAEEWRGVSVPAAMRAANWAKHCSMSRMQPTISAISTVESQSPPLMAATASVSPRMKLAKVSTGVGGGMGTALVSKNDTSGQAEMTLHPGGRAPRWRCRVRPWPWTAGPL